MANPPITGKIAKKRGKINMKTSKRKEKLSFKYKNHYSKQVQRLLGVFCGFYGVFCTFCDIRQSIKKDSQVIEITCESLSFQMEAASGFEPENSDFADRCLTTWLCRLKKMERETGFEPATSTLARSHSTTELFPPS